MNEMDNRFQFRAWHPEWNKMVYSTQHHECFGKREFTPWLFPIGFSRYPQDDRWIFMQCTGILDKNKTMLYEDDIFHIGNTMGFIVLKRLK